MGKTIRKKKWDRSPKGRKQAIVSKARAGATPPDAWDDFATSRKDVYYAVAYRSISKGLEAKDVAQKLISKAKKSHQTLSYSEALGIVEQAMGCAEWHKYRSPESKNYSENLKKRQKKEKELSLEIIGHLKKQKWLPNQSRQLYEWASKKAHEIFTNSYEANYFMNTKVKPLYDASWRAYASSCGTHPLEK